MVAFQDYYEFKRSDDRIEVNIIYPGQENDLFYHDPLFWCLTKFHFDSEQDDLANPALLFGFLGAWLNDKATTAKDKARIEQRFLDELASYAANAEILATIRLFRPKFSNMRTAEAKQINRSGCRLFTDATTYAQPHQYIKMATVFEKLEATPFPRRKRDPAWLEEADVVRQLSRDFLAICREMKLDLVSQPSHGRYIQQDVDEVLALLFFDSTEEHLAALQAERDAILAPKLPSTKNDGPAETSFSDWN
jgi:hypothetical protein